MSETVKTEKREANWNEKNTRPTLIYTETLSALIQSKCPEESLDRMKFKQEFRARKQARKLQPIFRQYRPKTMLDIGCGLAIASMLLADQYGLEKLILIDGDGTGDLFDDFRENSPAWNNVDHAMELISKNKHGQYEVEALHPNPPLNQQLDCIVSFKSWGYHYPIEVYIPLASRCLSSNGFIITDLHIAGKKQWPTQIAKMEKAGFKHVKEQFQGEETHLFVRG